MVDGEQLTAKQAEALRDELAELEGPRRDRGRRGDQEGARVRRPLRELRVPRCEERAGAARGAHPHAARAARRRRDRRSSARGDEVGVGSVVEVDGDGGQTMTVEISAVGGAGTVSPTSPLGVGAARPQGRRHRRRRGAEGRLAGDDQAHPLDRRSSRTRACEPCNTWRMATRPKQRNLGRLSEIAQVAVRHGFGYAGRRPHGAATRRSRAPRAAGICARCSTSSARRSSSSASCSRRGRTSCRRTSSPSCAACRTTCARSRSPTSSARSARSSASRSSGSSSSSTSSRSRRRRSARCTGRCCRTAGASSSRCSGRTRRARSRPTSRCSTRRRGSRRSGSARSTSSTRTRSSTSSRARSGRSSTTGTRRATPTAFHRNFAGHPHVAVPRVYWSYTRARVLTLEYLDGVQLADLDARRTGRSTSAGGSPT